MNQSIYSLEGVGKLVIADIANLEDLKSGAKFGVCFLECCSFRSTSEGSDVVSFSEEGVDDVTAEVS